jgi:hypothetical protein
MPAAAILSVPPASTFRPASVRTSEVAAKARESPSGGGVGTAPPSERATSGSSSARRLHAHASPRNSAFSRFWLSRKSSPGVRGPSPSWQDVLPREHRSAQTRLAEGVPGTLAVRYVEKGTGLGIAPAAGEVGGSAGAAVERIARAAEHARELVPYPAQAHDLLVDLVDLRGEAHTHRLGGDSSSSQPQMLLDLAEGEAETLRLLDRAHEAHGFLVVGAMPVRSSSRLLQQTAPFVVAQRLDVDPGAAGCLSNPHS